MAIDKPEKIQKLLNLAEEPAMAIMDELDSINDNLSQAAELFSNIDITNLEQLKGEKGDPGEKGPQGESIIGPIGPSGPQGPQGIPGKEFRGSKGDKGDRGESIVGPQGPQGDKGNDGSPDTPEQVRDKLAILKKDARLDKDSIKGLDDVVDRFALDRAISILDQRTQFLINKQTASTGGSVASVFGRTGAVVAQSGDYTTSQVTEGSNLYYTDARARSAISLTTIGTTGVATYNSTTGVLNIPNYASGSGTVTSVASADGSITVTNPTSTVDLAVVKAPIWSTTRLLAGNSVNGSANVPFANKFIVQGTTDAGLTGAQFLGALGTGIVKNTTTTGVLSIATAGTDYQAPITLTTTGTSGAATFVGNTLNIPQYQAAGTYVTSVGGTTNRITSTGGTTPSIDISATFEALLGKVANPLSQFAATTSAQLAGVISDETGSGALVFGTAPSISGATITTSTVNGVTLTTGGSTTSFLNANGTYTTPAGGGSPGGSTTQLQYNNAGAFGGISRITTNGNDLILTGQASPTYTQGKLVYDTDNESLTFYNNDSNVSLQIGQEEWTRVINNTGSTIANGAAIYFSGASGGLPTIALAKADAGATVVGAGLTTESIANGATGFVTRGGVVRGLDTSAFTAGQTVYISATTAGALTATAPTAPNYRYRVGIVAVSSSTIGTINVTPSTAALGNGTANQLFGMNTAGTAQEVKTITAGTGITVTPGTNTITIAATGGGGSAISNLTAAGATNTIDNTNYLQEWQWSTLASTGLKLSSSSTVAASNAQKVLEIDLTGANATSAQTTYGIYARNRHTGTTSANIAIYGESTGGTADNVGVYGKSSNSVGVTGEGPIGVYGIGSSTAAVFGSSSVTSAVGVKGNNAFGGIALQGNAVGSGSISLQANQSTLGEIVNQLVSIATNDDPTENVYQNRAATTDATVTTLHAFTIPSSTTMGIEVNIVARRTGGAAGTPEDGAFYKLISTYKNVAGAATIIGTAVVVATQRSNASWTAVFDTTGATARVRITGVASTNITWHMTARTWQVSS